MPNPKLRIVIQSRLTSSRLPGKALLPVAGFPSVVLCALRAANWNIPVTVATSTESSDDLIEEALKGTGVLVHRGSLVDVLDRYITATAEMEDEDFVARYTADNLFPDGNLLALLMSHERNLNSDVVQFDQGFPYGLGAGIVRVKWLRKAHESSLDHYDREHVTPWIERNCPAKLVPNPCKQKFGDLSHLRCTIDSLSDYLRVHRAFEAVGVDPITARWEDLVQALRDQPGAPKVTNPKIIVHGRTTKVLHLGTAQLGSNYGISNKEGLPSEVTAAKMLQIAIDAGVDTLDTARDYGESESRIGKLVQPGDADRLDIITKLGGLQKLPQNANVESVKNAVDSSIFRSCHELRLSKLKTLLLHRSKHLNAWHGAVWSRLLELQKEGIIGELGVSVYSPSELIGLIEYPQLRHIQLPFNLVDRRWLTEESQLSIQKLLAQNSAQITVRSVFLQGLLLMPASDWPPFEKVNSESISNSIRSAVVKLKRIDIMDLCIAYVRAHSWVHSIVIGAESTEQLLCNLQYVNRSPLTAEECVFLEAKIPGGPECLLNPVMWM